MQNKINPNPALQSLLDNSVSATKASTPSFNDQMLQQSRHNGFAKANKYLVMIFPNDRVQSAVGMRFVPDVARLAITCKSITINEQTWFTTEQADINPGATRIFPYKRNSSNSNGIRLQFNCGSDMFEKEFFDNWLRYIQDPVTKRFRYYDNYALRSEVYMLLLPDNVSNFYEAINAMYGNRITGYRFTEVYPYAMNINGGTLNYQTVQEPLYIDVGLMYHDVVQINEYPLPKDNIIRPVNDSGFPVIDSSWSQQILKDSESGLSRAVNGFVVGANSARQAFAKDESGRGRIAERNRSLLETYAVKLKEVNLDTPRAVDGLVVQPPPGNGALDLGLTILSQVQGFFGAGFYGNGFNP